MLPEDQIMGTQCLPCIDTERIAFISPSLKGVSSMLYSALILSHPNVLWSSALLQLCIWIISLDCEKYGTFQTSDNSQSHVTVPRRCRAKYWDFILWWNNLEAFSKPQKTGYRVCSLACHWTLVSGNTASCSENRGTAWSPCPAPPPWNAP